MSQTFVTINQATQTGTAIFGNLDDKAESLRTGFSGASAPSSPTPVDGQEWYDSTNHIMYRRINGAWKRVTMETLDGDLDLDDNELLNARLENLGAEETPAAGNVGKVYHHTGQSKAKVIVSATVLETVLSASAADFKDVWIPIGAWDLDATNPPTPVTIGTTPTIRGKEFDATNEKASFSFVVPAGWSGDADLKLRFFCYLADAQIASDTIDFAVNTIVTTLNADELGTKTSTASATVSHSIGANASQYSSHSFDVVLDFDDADNPIAAGDLVEVEFNLSAVSSVTGIVMRGVQVLSPVGTKITE